MDASSPVRAALYDSDAAVAAGSWLMDDETSDSNEMITRGQTEYNRSAAPRQSDGDEIMTRGPVRNNKSAAHDST